MLDGCGIVICMAMTIAPISEKLARLELKRDRKRAQAALLRQPKMSCAEAIENFARRQELVRRTSGVD